MSKGYFITGTDTEIGKTTVAAAILYLMKQKGLDAAGIKPIATGCSPTAHGLRSEDAELLIQHSSHAFNYNEVNPYVFQEAASPHIAARKAHATLKAQALIEHCQSLSKRVEYTLVEGVGGWCVPINDSETMADVAVGIGFPVIIVVGVRLGCINHAVLTVDAIQRSGLPIAGWVANIIDRSMDNVPEVLDTLTVQIRSELLGIIPPFRSVTTEKIAEYLTIDSLL